MAKLGDRTHNLGGNLTLAHHALLKDSSTAVCVVRIKLIFAPICIQHNQRPCAIDSSGSLRETSSVVTSYKTRQIRIISLFFFPINCVSFSSCFFSNSSLSFIMFSIFTIDTAVK